MSKTLRHHVGAISEQLACVWLSQRGFEVFRNVSAHGPVDIIALDPRTGDTLKFDVKTRRSTQGSKLTSEQQRLGVQLLYVEPDLHVVDDDPARFATTVARLRPEPTASLADRLSSACRA